MEIFNPCDQTAARVLATDLDGTLIPLPGREDNLSALATLREARQQGQLPLIFATGRHFESIVEAIEIYHLPTPDWMIGDVGSAIYERRADGSFAPLAAYDRHLQEVTHCHTRADVIQALAPFPHLDHQQTQTRTAFKTSYYCSASSLESLVEQIRLRLHECDLPYDCLGSIDHNGDFGFIDVLPRGVNKAYALLWLARHSPYQPEEILYAGDSGNDEAALASGFRAILVANATKGLRERVTAKLNERQIAHRLFCASQTATSGVLEGCRHFGLLP